jgi:NAD(P)-dependent dehydrogenase (short-subunit alcohol dehydrogenase family)
VFRDQHGVITGGSSGLGLELARMLADEGARLTLVARDARKPANAAAGGEAGLWFERSPPSQGHVRPAPQV